MNTLINTPPLSKTFISILTDIYTPADVLTAPEDCWAYGYDNSRIHALPQVVVFPTQQQQVVSTVLACVQYNIPITTRGRGTGTTGATTPLRGGMVLSMERMNRVIAFSPENRYIIVEPGMTNQQVQKLTASKGFFWPPDPTSAAYCSIGGNLAYNSAGPRAIKYGTPRENILGLSAVTGAGKEIKTGVITSKGVVGYDLTRLLIGSEGTLAIITSATLKLTPLAEAKSTFKAIYRSVHDAAKAVASIMSQPVTPCALEFIDNNAIELIRNHSNIHIEKSAQALLMIEVDGPKQGLNHMTELISKAANNNGLIDIQQAKTETEVNALWQTRKALAPSLRKAAPRRINEDVVVPVTEMPNLILGLETLSKKHQIPIINFGHAGNGNIHVNLLLHANNAELNKRAEHCLDDVFSLVLKLNGTLSGEHGIGIAKRDYIAKELDANSLELMRNIKNQFDPHNILNPDKIFPLA
ncbi:MAG: FAD-binding oxidoreductase [Methylococcaceae bacterium]